MNKRLEQSGWAQIKRYINSKDIGYVFTRRELLENLDQVKGSTIDTYRGYLEIFFILRRAGYGKYELIQKIPDEMNTSHFTRLISQEKWKRWFMPIKDRLERINN